MIEWGAPVPAFGDPSSASVATVGLNPSSREFMDVSGEELRGEKRRFHTLGSLGLSSWADADVRHLQAILDSCCDYFRRNPYDRWFKVLERVLEGTDASFYSSPTSACHLDLIPYATSSRWSDLSAEQRAALLLVSRDALAHLLRESAIRVVFLNGSTVVTHFQEIAGVALQSQEMPKWSLPRQSGPHVRGVSYVGSVEAFSGVLLPRRLLILGVNHNLQSSFGVTSDVLSAIRRWFARLSQGALS